MNWWQLAREGGRHVASVAAAVFLSTLLVFAALYAAPGDALTFLTGGRTISARSALDYREQYHLDDPFWSRYLHWIGGVLHGDFGESLISRQPVREIIGPRIETTLLLLAMATVIMMVAGIAGGMIAGLGGRTTDTVVSALANTALAIPAFVAATVLVAVFAVDLGWFPALGDGKDLLDRVYHLVLPSIALAIGSAAYVSRVTRVAIRAEMSREHVETARARGLPERVIVRRHVLRNALIPITTVTGLSIAGLIATSVVVESAFGLGGLGSLLVSSVTAKDFAVVQAVSLLLVVGFLLINLMVDLLYVVLDPRLRVAEVR